MRFARAGFLAVLAVLAAACDTTRPVEETAQTNDCARCHGYPPPAYVTAQGANHPTSTQCSLCHPGTVGPDNVTLIPGGLHMNGVVDVTGSHPLPYVDQHTGPALADIASCQACHGADYGGGNVGVSCNACHASSVAASAPDWRTNCTFCHGTRTANWTTARLPLAAPPQSVAGATAVSDPKVGAHQAHLVGTTLVTPLPCASCHAVPAATFPGSLDHVSGGPAQITFSALASQGVSSPSYANGSCTVYCHGATLQGGTQIPPSWTATSIACNGCHAASASNIGPATGRHDIHAGQPCGRCHQLTADAASSTPTVTTSGRAYHVNGQKEVQLSVSGTWSASAKTCSNVACHGGTGTDTWNP